VDDVEASLEQVVEYHSHLQGTVLKFALLKTALAGSGRAEEGICAQFGFHLLHPSWKVWFFI
jgi:hypothetical protein